MADLRFDAGRLARVVGPTDDALADAWHAADLAAARLSLADAAWRADALARAAADAADATARTAHADAALAHQAARDDDAATDTPWRDMRSTVGRVEGRTLLGFWALRVAGRRGSS